MNQEWNIKDRSPDCAECGRAFEDRQALFSRLDFTEEGYVRRDFCESCWDDGAKEGALSVWKSVFRVPAPPPEEPLKKETAESMLRQLMETDDPSKRNAIYILAVMLERRRVFAERDVQVRKDGVKIRVYEHKKTGESFLIPDPGLHLAELEEVQREVLELLGGGKKPDEEGPAEAAGDGEQAPPEG